ncbi:MAG: fimbrillin family protein [Bacteroidales bacterium]|nr:fimbrillin family protein [Bacteroidales bacterium]
MKKYIFLLVSLLFVSCQGHIGDVELPDGDLELAHIKPTIVSGNSGVQTRADGDTPTPPVVYLEDAISRYKFIDGDRMTFTSIHRSISPIDRFNYHDVTFQSNDSGAWDRDKDTGHDNTPDSGVPARIYWSDATSEHTFIGYSLPKLSEGVFDWTPDGAVYGGSIGKYGETGQINFNPDTPETETITVDGKNVFIPVSSRMRDEDILLAYDTEVVADESIAYIKFYHGLSSVKVKVMLGEFYGSELDGYTIVENMVLKDQPTLYKWDQLSNRTTAKSNIHSDNNPRDMNLWDYVPEGTGDNAGKTFTFYGITVPQEDGYEAKDLKLTFTVRYPDPLKTDINELRKNKTQPTEWKTQQYEATIPSSKRVFFHAGQCTVINIKLNHRDEEITIGAQYTDWEFVPTPDEGSLKKNDTFLQAAPAFGSRPTTGRVTVANDQEANEDDATWLYYKMENNAFVPGGDDGKVLLDIYGNNGTEQKPYTISTANQLLSFAYEVSNGGVGGTTGRSFEGKYVKLDADIVLQKKTSPSASELITWLGIGDSTHPFQGTFLGGGRKISMIRGNALFANVGANARIDRLGIINPVPYEIDKNTTAIYHQMTGNAVLAETNAGVICACMVDGDIKASGSGAAGALVGTNSGTVFACYHLGAVESNATVGGLVGSNTGSICFSYQTGELKGSSKYGISQGGTITSCYYDSKQAPAVEEVSGVTGMTTGSLQTNTFVTEMNDAIQNWSGSSDHLKAHRYIYNPATFPTVE